jgi:DNA-directed RNA polymerase specialized sigma24 family protein
MLYSIDYHGTEIHVPKLSETGLRTDAYPDTDEQLIDHIKDGDEAALGILLYRHIGACRALAHRIVPQDPESENLVHSVFAEISREAARYSPEAGSVIGWILTLVRRRSIEHLCGQTKAKTPSQKPTVPAIAEAPTRPTRLAA